MDSEKVRRLSVHMRVWRRRGQVKHKFMNAEDVLLRSIVARMRSTDWAPVTAQMCPFTARQCRERWTNYLNPGLQNIEWTSAEDPLLEKGYAQVEAKWRVIADYFPARSKNNVKNRWLRLQRIKGRVEQARQAAPGVDTSRVTTVRDSILSQSVFEATRDGTAWDAVFNDFPG
jgi:hypothetical protein